MRVSTEELALYGTLIAFFSTSLTLIVKAILKSNCVSIECCCMKCHREIDKELEKQIDVEFGESTPSTSTQKK